ncbi:hypothetical protein B0O99DRAFT_73683 [Bisporella sp. PMI_857]|nr:hypothetical protein B0O99DRAFT_73683 [Bisporella sp. PMI_857]
MANSARGYKKIMVENFSSQQREDRYPDYDEDEALAELEEDEISERADDEPPLVAAWRSNLVAISKKHNLYFFASRAKLHVTVPRGLRQTLTGKPDLIIDLPRTPNGESIGGVIDDRMPHCVNNMMIGNLGTHEIILMACDDGDIIAYYTHVINTKIVKGNDEPMIILRPMLHENVGMSAWGLAVHEKSRMLAVSSNLKEVTVFLPAIGDGIILRHLESEEYVLYPEEDTNSPLHKAFRRSNYRKIIRFPPMTSNIPSIDFYSDQAGEATSIIAIDILGTVSIQALGMNSLQRIPSIYDSRRGSINHNLMHRFMGWGVLAIPLGICYQTTTIEETVGVGYIESVLHTEPLMIPDRNAEDFFENTPDMTTANIARNWDMEQPTPLSDASAFALDDPEAFDDFEGDDIFEEGDIFEEDEDFGFMDLPEQSIGLASPRNDSNLSLGEESDETRITSPSEDDTKEFLANLKSNVPLFMFPTHTAILRIYATDVELIPPTLPRTICKQIVDRVPGTNPALLQFKRLNMYAFVPELSLVIVASQAGRAALITITRPAKTSPAGPVMSFRLDRIIPSRKQEQDDLRPPAPLLGMAVAPLQMNNTKQGRNRRWRLFLHYYDHTILSYELRRDDADDALLIF